MKEMKYRTYLPLQRMEPLIPQVTVCSLQKSKVTDSLVSTSASGHSGTLYYKQFYYFHRKQ